MTDSSDHQTAATVDTTVRLPDQKTTMVSTTFYESRWFWRRTMAYISLAFCLAMLSYLAVWSEDSTIDRDIANICMIVMLTVITGYMGFATLDDRNVMIHGRGQSTRDPTIPPDGPPS